MAKKQSQKRKGGTAKIGRDKIKCERYRRENRRHKNKLSRLIKRLKGLSKYEDKDIGFIKGEAKKILN